MSNQQVTKVVTIAAAAAALLAASLPPAAAEEAEHARGGGRGVYKARVIRSIIATGLNDSFGIPPFDLGAPFGTFSFAMLGAHLPSASEPLRLGPSTPNSALLTTIADPSFLQLAGKTRADVQPGWENVPLREVPINVDFASIATHGNGIKRPLSSVLAAGPIDVAQAEPARPVTAGLWRRGRGTLKIVCYSTERAWLKMTVRRLLPNRMYGIGATMGGPHAAPVEQRNLVPFTIGGVPHVFVTDEHGNGAIERDINFCPLDPASTERPLLVMNLLYYSRHQNYGAVPEPVFVNGLWLGMVTHNHLQFPVNVEMNPAWQALHGGRTDD